MQARFGLKAFQLNLVIKLFPLVVLTAAVVIWSALNATGFCFAQTKFPTNEEYLSEFLHDELFMSPSTSQIHNWTGDSVKSVKHFPSGKIYLKNFPDCCFFDVQTKMNTEGRLAPPNIFVRLTGHAWRIVVVRSAYEYVTTSGETKVFEPGFTGFWADSCGRLVPAVVY